MSRKYQLRTLGCKVNQYESQQFREILESRGWRPAGPGETPDLALVNTCAVTARASAKTRQTVRRVSPHGAVPVVVVGCGAAAEAERLRRLPGVFAVWGHQDDPVQHLHRYLVHRLRTGPDPGANQGGGRRWRIAPRDAGSRAGEDDGWMSPGLPAGRLAGHSVRANPHIHNSIPPPPGQVNGPWPTDAPIRRFEGHVRAFLKVQDGCDASCTYCIIPRLRPALGSKPIEAVVAEAEGLVRAGHREIVLTGIFLGAYGRPTAVRSRFTSGHSPLAELVDAVAGVEGLVRLRLSSLEPGDVDDHLLDVLASRRCCVPHLHLPLQVGSPGVLRRMNRQYGVEDYLAMIDRVTKALDRPAVSTDILVGFPGETEDDFENTLDVVRRVGFCKIHAFPFSPRDKTAAARWTDRFVDPGVVRQRMARLRKLERQVAGRYQEQFVGTVQRVLVESGSANRNGASFTNEVSAVGDSAGGMGPPRADPCGGHEHGSTIGGPMPPTISGDGWDGSAKQTRAGLERTRVHHGWTHATYDSMCDRALAAGDSTLAGEFHGRTDRYFELWFEAPAGGVRPGDVVWVRVDGVSATRVHGTLVVEPSRGIALPSLGDHAA